MIDIVSMVFFLEALDFSSQEAKQIRSTLPNQKQHIILDKHEEGGLFADDYLLKN
jgi:hypothetical protein